ncbi:MAG TPA: aldehyde dehydrogenase family protein, partial [Flavobacteriales bacterium]|nr:aldehyde dehydrogenase family protein [Flavobacteriales bacterium]
MLAQAELSVLESLGIEAKNQGTSTGSNWLKGSGEYFSSSSPVDGKELGSLEVTSKEAYEEVIRTAQKGFSEWRTWPAPKRGEIVRQFGDLLRKHKDALGTLVSYEMGKSLQEGKGEVQEMIDICDFA